ncbi:hypothetical protein ACA758_04970 [Mycoplasmopsis agassizii]|nr:hypothetical protein [Mycoplasmopsis agassizii]SMC17175.1 hypothetical protein SAMN02745179_00412 [Mycoplasmopsis agassizii]
MAKTIFNLLSLKSATPAQLNKDYKGKLKVLNYLKGAISYAI